MAKAKFENFEEAMKARKDGKYRCENIIEVQIENLANDILSFVADNRSRHIEIKIREQKNHEFFVYLFVYGDQYYSYAYHSFEHPSAASFAEFIKECFAKKGILVSIVFSFDSVKLVFDDLE